MENEAVQQAYAITDDAGAERALLRIREAQAESEKWADFYTQQSAKIKAQTDETVAYYKGLLAQYFGTVPHHATKGGTEKYKLPSGELVRKPSSVEYQREPDKLLAWAKAHDSGEFVKVTETAKWAEIKTYMKATGDIPDGVTPVEVPSTFEVKF